MKAIPTITERIDTGRRISLAGLHKMPPAASCAGPRRPPARRGPKKISVARLPVTGSDVFGREEDITFLNDAWANQHSNVVTIVAWAGVGKSTLVNRWLRGMAAENYRSAELVFGWSLKKVVHRYRIGTADVLTYRVCCAMFSSLRRPNCHHRVLLLRLEVRTFVTFIDFSQPNVPLESALMKIYADEHPSL